MGWAPALRPDRIGVVVMRTTEPIEGCELQAFRVGQDGFERGRELLVKLTRDVGRVMLIGDTDKGGEVVVPEDGADRVRVALDYSADAYLASKASAGLTLQQVLTDPRWFGLDASPLQRALCEWADGRPANDVAIDASGYADDIAERMTLPWVVGPVPTVRPGEVNLLAGIRCGKSLLFSEVKKHPRCSSGAYEVVGPFLFV